MQKIIIAIDGHSSCGKSTMAKDLAKEIGYKYIDSGAMYRAVTLYGLQKSCFINNKLDVEALEKELPNIDIYFEIDPVSGSSQTHLNGENVEQSIRRMEVASKVSFVSEVASVRKFLVAQQQAMGAKKGIVMDGRDICTVVFPEAALKIFLTARPEVRAQRRFDELKAKQQDISLAEVLDNLNQRDLIDSTRKESPLRCAPDAIVLDNSDMSIEQQKQWLLKKFKEKTIFNN